MTASGWNGLRQLFLAKYAELVPRLTRHLGSRDLAIEVLHNVYVRLAERTGEPEEIKNPLAYFYRAAQNVAINMQRQDRRHSGFHNIDAALEIPDDSPSAQQVLEVKSQMQMIAQALDELSPRRRAIFIAAFYKETPHKIIAEQFGISVRTVRSDLQFAFNRCARRLGKL